MNTDRQTVIYQQDCEFIRHHERLGWIRIVAAGLAEGGTLTMAYRLASDEVWDEIRFMTFGFGLVFFATALSLRDGIDALRYYKRARLYEGESLRLDAAPVPFMSGFTLRLTGIVLLNVFNVGLLLLRLAQR